jgi:hypothetical protein
MSAAAVEQWSMEIETALERIKVKRGASRVNLRSPARLASVADRSL